MGDQPETRELKCWTRWLIAAVLAVVFVYWFPLFRIIPLDAAEDAKQAKKFDPKAFAQEFWDKRLPGAESDAIDAVELVAALAIDSDAAKEKYGRKLGIGDTVYFHLRGRGNVTGTGESILLAMDDGQDPSIALPTGLLFSNAVRDATGLINVSDFASSRHFNDVTTELNRIVEESVIPELKQRARIGAEVQFVGCAELAGDAEVRPLEVVPVSITFTD